MLIIDATMRLEPGMLTYEGDPPFWSHAVASPVEGHDDTFGMTMLLMGSHSGTHLDAPRHMFASGHGIGDVGLGVLCGPARVVDVTEAGLAIDDGALRACALDGVARLLLKTANGRLAGKPFTFDHAHLTPSAARYLRDETSVKLVGIDYLSIERHASDGFPVHRTLLEGPEPILILEGLDLRSATGGDYELWCLPLALGDADGAPARVVLVRR